MERLYDLVLEEWPRWSQSLGILAGTLAVGYVAVRLVVVGYRRWRARQQQPVSEAYLRYLSRALLFWVLLLALFLSLRYAPLEEPTIQLLQHGLLIAWVVSLTLVSAALGSEFIRRYGSRLPGGLSVTTLTHNLVRIVVFTLGGLIVLNMLGISIAPILTALGVGGLAVALALQDTLANLFAGFYVSVAGQVRVGDYIRLDSGEEGYVTDISWRCTTIRMLANNLIIVPNAKLAQAIVTNYHLPEKRMSLLIPVSVSYDSDLDEVERVLVEEARAGTNEIPGLLAEPEPFVRFIPGFGESSLNLTLICQVAEFVDQYRAQHELRKRILRRFRQSGIQIPFPIRTVHLHSADGSRGADGGQP
jgi:small-conductance mechanosensitive channel